MPNMLIYQTFYDDLTRSTLDPDFIPLDNSSNERPDWREYWPIRNYLRPRDLEPGTFYGFLSPRFKEKTRLTGKRVAEFVASLRPEPDVVILTPHIGWDFSTLFPNVLHQGEFLHPGLLAATNAAFHAIGLPAGAPEVLSDSRTAVFSNFFVAKPAFWHKWFEINEKLFAVAEDEGSPAGELLRRRANYRADAGPVAYKVFLMERIATLILCLDATFKVRHYPSDKVLAAAPLEALACDALKIAMAARPDDKYRLLFEQLSNSTRDSLPPSQRPST